MQIKDSVRDCLEKDPKERNEDEIIQTNKQTIKFQLRLEILSFLLLPPKECLCH